MAENYTMNNARGGGMFFNDTAAHAATSSACSSWVLIQILEATKFAVLTGNTAVDAANATAGSAYSFPAGTILEGNWSTFTLHSGAVIAYKSQN